MIVPIICLQGTGETNSIRLVQIEKEMLIEKQNKYERNGNCKPGTGRCSLNEEFFRTMSTN